MARVRIVYFEGCPHAQPAAELVRGVAAELAVQVSVKMVRVRSAEEAHRKRMLGSPTLQVNGVDVEEPPARGRRDYALGCRVFDGGHGIPLREMVARALAKA